MKKYSISQLAKTFGLARSTLLYYDAIGLLKPATRSSSNYRVYTEEEYDKLKRITSLRKTGISLEEIRQILDTDITSITSILHNRIDQINDKIKELRFQQNVILKLLNSKKVLQSARIMTKEIWVDLLRSAGLNDEGMYKWHMEFESSAPEAHQDFLESLGLSSEEVANIRKWSKIGS